MLRLEGELAEVEVHDDVLAAGGGATNAVCLHKARAAGLGGFEFACAIPGTAGGGVQDERRRVRTGLDRRARPRSRLSRRRLRLAHCRRARPDVPSLGAPAGRRRRACRVPARPTTRGRDPGHRVRARRTAEGDPADEQAHVRERLQEPARGHRGGAHARALRAQGASHRRRGDLARSTRTSSRTPATRRAPTASR